LTIMSEARGRAIPRAADMARVSDAVDAGAMQVDGDTGTLLGVIDFSYQHYALGDLLTTQVELATMAIERGLGQIDLVAMVNPGMPSARMQSFVTPDNYVSYLDPITAVLACNPMLRSLRLIRDVKAFNLLILARHRSGAPMWPDFRTHLQMRQDYPIGHDRLNAFFFRHGYLPRLVAPRHYEPWARRFHRQELAGRPLVIINPRQGSLTHNPAALYRDAVLSSWYAFIDAVALRDPRVLFVMVGGYPEWEHRLLHRGNVFIPRAFGLSLAHELALMKIADLFMGSSSGFATFATFTDIPYAILNFEHRFAPHGGMTVGDRHYPFARADQVITWERETTGQLLALFDELRGGAGAAGKVAGTSGADGLDSAAKGP
jgi:hypothetical protein